VPAGGVRTRQQDRVGVANEAGVRQRRGVRPGDGQPAPGPSGGIGAGGGVAVLSFSRRAGTNGRDMATKGPAAGRPGAAR